MRKKAWAITDWGGGIKHPSVSIFDTKKDAQKRLNALNRMPDPNVKGSKNKIVRIELRWCENNCDGKDNTCSECVL